MENHKSKAKPKASKQFKTEILKVTLALLLFVIVYVILFALALGAAVSLTYWGIQLILLRPALFTLLIGGGLSLTGCLFFYFMIKFIFFRAEKSTDTDVEISPADYPVLYAFITDISNQIGTDKPKKIALFPGVNASVHYDSAFLSMFFPAKKNLNIGMGLVSSVNVSEFKAIIAHEFGHFSQKSMRIGSYVYNFNKIIYNMLYENNGFNKILESIGKTHAYISLFAALTAKIIISIQWVLQGIYVLLNKTNMSLSREMEHHADAIAGWASGSNHLISGLQRIEIGDTCFKQMTDYLNKMIVENKKPENVYPLLTEFIKDYARTNNYELINNLPVINRNNVQNRISIVDQWASHPSLSDRQKYLAQVEADHFETDERSAWTLFNQPEAIQKQLTDDFMYATVKFDGTPTIVSLEEMVETLHAERQKNSLPADYKQYYDYRVVTISPDNLPLTEDNIPIETLFADDITDLPRRLLSLQEDIQSMQYLKQPDNRIKRFEFDGKSMSVKKADEVINILQTESDNIAGQIEHNDNLIFSCALKKGTAADNSEIKQLYAYYSQVMNNYEEFYKHYNEFSNTLLPIYTDNLPIDRIKFIIKKAKQTEVIIKEFIRTYSDQIIPQGSLTTEEENDMQQYLTKDQTYFHYASFDNEELELMTKCQTVFIRAFFDVAFRHKKAWLDKQHQLLIK